MKKHIKKIAIRWYTITAVLLIGLTLPSILGGCDFINKVVGNVYGKANDHKKRGDAYLGQGQYASATAEYTRAIELSTDNKSKAEAYYLRGLSYALQKQYAGAIDDYDEAMRLTTDKTLRTHAQQEKEKVKVDVHTSEGYEYLIQGQYDKAIEEYTKALKLNKDNVSAYKYRGRAYGKQKRYSEAIADYTKVIELTRDKKLRTAAQQDKAEAERAKKASTK